MRGRFATRGERLPTGFFLATLIALAAPARASVRGHGIASPENEIANGIASAANEIASPAASIPVEDKVLWTGAVELPDSMKLEISVELGKDSGTITIPMQHAKDVPLSGVVVTDKSLKFGIPSAGAVWELAIADDGKTAKGVLRQAGSEFPTILHRRAPGEVATKELVRPQDPKPPLPYPTSEVEFENAAAKAKFAGTLALPEDKGGKGGNGPFPCVVFITGSGPQDRDEALMGHRPFLVISDYLARHGIASLRYDDRGVAKSTGTFEGSTSDDFADDALAAVAFLKTRKEIDPKHIGIIGHSEGGLIAPMCAAKSKDVAFIVLLAGTGISGAELMPIQARLVAVSTGTAAADAEVQSKTTAEIFAMVLAGKSDAEIREKIRLAAEREIASKPEAKSLTEDERKKKAEQVADVQSKELLGPWFRRFLVLDPKVALRKTTCPVLALNGSLDMQVPPKENLPAIERALKEGGNKDVTCVELPGLNHLFQTCKTGSPTEYGDIEETIAPKALETMTSWIRKRTGLE
jgi:pimeloyl-ACP methyl ester carboxylesterase